MTGIFFGSDWMSSTLRARCQAGACLYMVLVTGSFALAADSGAGDSGAPEHHAHDMTPEIYAALREKVPLYQDYTDAEIDLSMLMMGPNYAAYVSEQDLAGPIGVLVLAHGFGEVGDRVFQSQLDSIGRIFPTAVGFGMSMMESTHIQSGVDQLVAAGAEKIVVVPALSSPWNTQMRQWEYMFGIHDDAGYLETERIRADAEVLYTPSLEDHPLVAEALLDHAKELSTEPERTLVIVVSHGPTAEADNQATLAMLERLADFVSQDGGFAAVRSISLQNDAPTEIRDANVARLRDWVASASSKGLDVVVVTNLLATRSIQSQIRQDLAGLEYQFNAKGLTQHPNFQKWIQESVRKALARS